MHTEPRAKSGVSCGEGQSAERERRLAPGAAAARRRRPRPRTLGGLGRATGCSAQASRSVAANSSGQDPRRLRVVRRQRRPQHDRAVRRSARTTDIGPRSASRKPTSSRIDDAVRLAQVDARHEEPLRRRQGGDRARRRLRPAVVLALHVAVVLAHGRAEQWQRVRLGRPYCG